MRKCVISTCRNNKMIKYDEGVTYHSFPKDLQLREIWVAVTGRLNWTPSRDSRICSEHFEEKYFILNGSLRKLRPNAIPTLNVLTFHPQIQIDFTKFNDVSSIMEELGIVEQNVNVSLVAPKKQTTEENDYRMAVLKEQKLETMLKWTEKKIKMCTKRKKIHRGRIRHINERNEKIHSLLFALTNSVLENKIGEL